MVPGHETIGEVVAVGPGEKTWKIGDRVGAPWHGGHDCKSASRSGCGVTNANVERDSNLQVVQAGSIPDVRQRGDQRSHP